MNNRFLMWVVGLVGFALAIQPAFSQTTSLPSTNEKYNFTSVTEFCDKAYRAAELPGASLMLYRDGQVIYEKYFGEYNEATQVPIASASKWLSGAVIMSLVDENKIELDAPVSMYLPNFTGTAGTMTVRQMFSHTSGLVDFPGGWNYSITIAEYADRIAKEGVWRAEPGREIRYAGASMQVAGSVAEVVSGQSWNELVKDRLTVPCEMPNTIYARTELNKNPMLAGGAFSTLRDYGHFLEMIMNSGVYRGRRVLSEAAVREMQKDQTNGAPLVTASNDRMGLQSCYGIGEWIDVQDSEGHTLQVSSPGAFGFRPWINHPRKLFGIWMVHHPRRAAGEPTKQPAYNPWDLIDLIHKVVDETAP